MEENKTREINKKGGKGERGERERERERLGLRKMKENPFNNHPYNQEP